MKKLPNVLRVYLTSYSCTMHNNTELIFIVKIMVIHLRKIIHKEQLPYDLTKERNTNDENNNVNNEDGDYDTDAS